MRFDKTERYSERYSEVSEEGGEFEWGSQLQNKVVVGEEECVLNWVRSFTVYELDSLLKEKSFNELIDLEILKTNQLSHPPKFISFCPLLSSNSFTEGYLQIGFPT